MLAELADRLVAVHGQTDQLRLIRPAEQRAALDRFAAAATPVADGPRRCTRRLRAVARGRAGLRDRRARARELRREAELLRHGLAEIEAAAPQPGEDVDAGRRGEPARARGRVCVWRPRTAHDAVLGDADDPRAGEPTSRRCSAGPLGARTTPAPTTPNSTRLRLAAGSTELAAAVDRSATELASYLADLDAEPGPAWPGSSAPAPC